MAIGEEKMRGEVKTQSLPAFILNTIICGAIFLGILFYHWYFPVSYNFFMSEDSWAEYGTFACYFLASLSVFWLLVNSESLRRPGYILFCTGLLFVAMEEISWGQRLLAIQTPQIIAQFNDQSEISLHNATFFRVEHILFYAIFTWAVILPEIVYWFNGLAKLVNQVGLPLVPRGLYPYFILGMFLKNNYIVVEYDEVGELIFGLAFVLFAVEMCSSSSKCLGSGKLKKWQRITVAVSAVSVITAALVLVKPPEIYGLRRTFHKAAIADYPRFKMTEQAAKIFEYLLRHEELQSDDTLLQYGLFLKRSGHDKATEILLKALENANGKILADPDKPAYFILAGKALTALGQNDLAQAEFVKAVEKYQIRLAHAELNWQKADALKSLGEIYIEMDEYPSAKEYLQKAEEYADDGWSKRKIQQVLKRIKDF